MVFKHVSFWREKKRSRKTRFAEAREAKHKGLGWEKKVGKVFKLQEARGTGAACKIHGDTRSAQRQGRSEMEKKEIAELSRKRDSNESGFLDVEFRTTSLGRIGAWHAPFIFVTNWEAQFTPCLAQRKGFTL